RSVRSEAEALPTPPTESSNEQLAVRRGNLQRIIGNSIEIGSDLVRIEMTHRFGSSALRKICRSASVRSHTGQKIRSDREIARFRDLVSNFLGPISEAKDFVDDEHGGSFVLRFGIDHERLDRTAVVLDCDPFTMARRFL